MSVPVSDGLAGRTAIVTGGSKGIGLAISAQLAAAGANVVITSRRQANIDDAVEHVVALLGGHVRGQLLAVAANAGEVDQIDACVDQAVSRFGAVDLLVNNAATNPYQGELMGISLSAAAKTAQVNQWGVVAWVQAVWKASMSERGGSIVNIASIGGMTVDRGIGYYNATKAAIIHLTRQLAFELAPRVRVNCVAPGLVKTDMARALWEARENELAGLIPLGRLGDPSDIASAVTFLLGAGASWITGQTLAVDGGAMNVPIDVGLDG